MSHLIIKITRNGEIEYSQEKIGSEIEIIGILGNYFFKIPAFNQKNNLNDNCKIGIHVFPINECVYFLKEEHKHMYNNGSLCLGYKGFKKTKGSIKQFLEFILIPYIAGYYNFRTSGEWFNEHKGNDFKDFKNHDKAFLIEKKFDVKVSKKHYENFSNSNNVWLKKQKEKRKEYKKYVKTKK